MCAEFPDIPEYLSDLARGYSALGFVVRHRLPEAEKAFTRAVEIQERLAADSPERSAYWEDLSDIYLAYAHALLYQIRIPKDWNGPNYEAAEKALRRCLEIEQKLGRADQSQFVHALANLGAVFLNMDRQQEAEEFHRRALEMCRRLVDDSPQDLMLVENLGGCHGNVAWFLVRAGRLAEAEKPLRDCLTIRERMATEFPNTPVVHLHLARTLTGLSELLWMTARRQESLDAYRRAVAIYEKLATRDPTLTYTQVRLAWYLATGHRVDRFWPPSPLAPS